MLRKSSGAVTDDRADSVTNPDPDYSALPGNELFQPPLWESGREIHKAVWTIAWPSVLTMLLQTFNGLMDTLFVGHLPHAKQALAATGIGGQVVFLLIALAMGVSVGTTALVARFTGANSHEERLRATGQSLTLSFVISVVVCALFYTGRNTIVGWMLTGQTDAETTRLCSQFLGIALLATVPMFLMNTLMGAFRGLGDTRTPMLVQSIAIATHITCNWMLIYGHFGLPALGVRGAATALAVSIFVSAILYVAALKLRSPLRAALSPRYLAFDLTGEWYKRILKIGLPASIQAVIRSLAMMSFTGLLARTAEGSSAVAAMSIGVRAEAIAYMPGFGYSVAASALVGQYLGAKNIPRAERSAWAATTQAMLVMAFVGLGFYLFSEPLAGLFTSDPGVRHLGALYLKINSVCEPFMALGMVLTGGLQGAGDTIRPTFITLFTMWVVRLPLSYWLMFHCNLQTAGAWWAMCVTAILGGVITAALFQTGWWKKIKV